MKNKVQKFGKFLSGMVMPNIGALIAFGFLAALFIDTGWIPNEKLNSMVSPMLTYLIPILIASTGGKMVGGDRGRVVGAIAVIGAIMSDTSITMLMAAMLMGPLAGFCIKKFDQLMDGHMPAGFEMLINNFSAGIIGMLLAILGYVVVGPVMSGILAVLAAGVNILVSHSLLPLVAIFIEPAKVLFLNNAINHGIFTPLATAQAAEVGKSIMYMLEPNPGPGLGVLLAYMFCKDKKTKQSAPGAVIIHVLGGIHEIYFPYILMNPLVIIAPIVGNMVAIFWFNLTGCGLVGPASPGSLIAYLMMTPGTDIWKVLVGVAIATGISFAIASPIVKIAGGKTSLEDAQAEMAAMKAESKGEAAVPAAIKDASEVKKIIFACDAGMGSSAMGATKFRNRLKMVCPQIHVSNTSVDNIPADCDIAVVQMTLADRARKSAPQAQLVTIGNFLADPALDELYEQLTNKEKAGSAQIADTNVPAEKQTEKSVSVEKQEEKATPVAKKQVLIKDGIRLNQAPVSKEEAIQVAGELLHQLGYVDETYVDAMQEREKLITTYMGMGVAIPHGTSQAKGTVKKTGIVFFQYPEGVDFGDEKAQLVFGIAGIGDEHLDLLAKICEVLEDEEVLEKMKTTSDLDWVMERLS